MTLEHIHPDLWMVIFHNLTLEDVLNCKQKIFGVSRGVFLSLIGCEISQFTNDYRDGGVFYKMLMEKLIVKQLDLVIDRIVNRKLLLHVEGDYDEETNSHDISDLIIRLSTEGRGRGRVRVQFSTRSRLNVESCGMSMSKLRGKLMSIVGICHDQFPHIYEEYKTKIGDALKRSIKICTQVLKPNVNSNFSYIDNCNVYPKKPSFWEEEKREQSIILKLKKTKVKDIQCRIKWAFEYRNHLLGELEYQLDHLKTQYRVLKSYGGCKYNPEHYADVVGSIHEIVSKFDEEFQKQFYTERNFYFKKTRGHYRRRTFLNTSDNVGAFNFIEYTILSISKIHNHYSLIAETTGQHPRLMQMVDKQMELQFKYYGNSFREHIPNTTVYHYLVRMGENRFYDYFTPELKDHIKNSPEKTQQTFVLSLVQSAATHFPIELVELLNFPLEFEKKSRGGKTRKVSVADTVFNSPWSHNQNPLVKKWIEFLVNKFGKREFMESIPLVTVYNFSYTLSFLGDEIAEKIHEAKTVFEGGLGFQ